MTVSALLNYLAMHEKEQGLLFKFSDGSLLIKSRHSDKFLVLLQQAGIYIGLDGRREMIMFTCEVSIAMSHTYM